MAKSILHDTWLVERKFVHTKPENDYLNQYTEWETELVYKGSMMHIIDEVNRRLEHLMNNGERTLVRYPLCLNGSMIDAESELIEADKESVKKEIEAGGGFFFEYGCKKYRIMRISTTLSSLWL